MVVLFAIFDTKSIQNSLPKIVALEVLGTFFIKQLLVETGLFLSSNMPLITIVRDITIFFAIIYTYKNRVNIAWHTIVLLYSASFIYNFATFIDLWLVDTSLFSSNSAAFKTSGLYSSYSFVSRVIMSLIILSLIINFWIGGVRNSLANRLYFIHSRINNDRSNSGGLLRRTAKFREKRLS